MTIPTATWETGFCKVCNDARPVCPNCDRCATCYEHEACFDVSAAFDAASEKPKGE